MGFWFTFFLYLGAFIVTELLRPKPNIENAKPAALGDFQRPTAQEGRVVPIIWGTVRVNGPNLLWYGDLKTEPITEKVKTGLFSSDRITIGYKYSIGMQFGLCQGPLEADALGSPQTGTYGGIGRIWVDDELLRDSTSSPQPGVTSPEEGFISSGSININAPTFFGEDSGGIVGTLTVYNGDGNQSVSSYMNGVSGLDSTLLTGYRNTAFVEFEQVYIGNSPTIRPWAFEVRRIPDGLDLRLITSPLTYPDDKSPGTFTNPAVINNRDANPMNVLYEILTNPDWGLGLTNINTNSLVAAGVTLAREGQGYSRILDRSLEAVEIIREIEQQVDGFLYQNAETGNYEFKLTRESDYDDVSPIPEFNEDNILPNGFEFTRGTWAETSNVVQVQYTDPDKDYTTTFAQAQDNANRLIQGGVTRVATVTYPGLFDGELAAELATREIRSLSYPLAKGTIKADRSHYSLLPGDLAKVTWPPFDIEDLFVRITRMQLGSLESNEIIYSFVEDIFETPVATFVKPDGTLWTPPSTDPASPVASRLWALPLQYQDDGTIQQYGVLAARANDVQTSFEVHVAPGGGSPPNPSDSEYVVAATSGQFTPSGLLVGDFPKPVSNQSPAADQQWSYNNDTLTIDSTVDISVVSDSIAGASYLESNTPTNLALIDDEIILFESITDDGGGQYTLNGVHRGMLDTVPADHDNDARIWFFTYGMAVLDGDLVQITSNVVAKILSVALGGTQELSDVSALTLPTTNRYQGARPPLNLTFNTANLRLQTPGITLDDPFTLEMRQVENLLNDNREFTHEEFFVDPGNEDDYTYNLAIYDVAESPRVEVYSETYAPGSPGNQGLTPYDWTISGWTPGSPKVSPRARYQVEVWTTKNGYASQRWQSFPLEKTILSPESPLPPPSPQSPQGALSPQSPQVSPFTLPDISAVEWNPSPLQFEDYVNSGQDTGTGITFNGTGTRMYTANDASEITEFEVPTPWDVTSINSSPQYIGSHESTSIVRSRSIGFNDDGTKFYVADFTNGFIAQFNLSTAYDVSEIDGVAADETLSVSTPLGFAWSDSGGYLHVIRGVGGSVDRYTCSTPYDISTASSDYTNASSGMGRFDDMTMSNDGTRVWILDPVNDAVEQWTMSTAHDLRSASVSLDSPGIGSIAYSNNPTGMHVDETQQRVWINYYNDTEVYQFDWV